MTMYTEKIMGNVIVTSNEETNKESNKETVLGLLKLLMDNKAKYVYNSNYKIIGKQVIDDFYMFVADKKLQTTNIIGNVVFNEKELNVSIRNKIEGIVKINPIQARMVNLTSNVKAVIFRNHTIIKDGNLNMDSINVVINKNVLNTCLEKGIVTSSIQVNDDEFLVNLDLTNLPLVNGNVIDRSKLLKATMRNNELVAEQKVVKYFLNNIETTNTEYTEEQSKLLAEFGIINGVYNGIDNHTEDKGTYEVRNLILQIKGDASVPSVNAILKLKKTPTKGIKLYMLSLIKKYEAITSNMTEEDKVEMLNNRNKEINDKINTNKLFINEQRFILNGITEGFEYNEADTTLVVKVTTGKHYF